MKLVTGAQAQKLREMARSRGVTKQAFEVAIKDGHVDYFLDSLGKIVPPPIKEVKGLMMKDGKVVYFLDGLGKIVPIPSKSRVCHVAVRVKQDSIWSDAIKPLCGQFPDENLQKLGDDQYPPIGIGEALKDLILINYPKGDDGWEQALAWGDGMGFKRTSPRDVFALNRQMRGLCELFGVSTLQAVSTTECTFQGKSWTCEVSSESFHCTACLTDVPPMQAWFHCYAFIM